MAMGGGMSDATNGPNAGKGAVAQDKRVVERRRDMQAQHGGQSVGTVFMNRLGQLGEGIRARHKGWNTKAIQRLDRKITGADADISRQWHDADQHIKQAVACCRCATLPSGQMLRQGRGRIAQADDQAKDREDQQQGADVLMKDEQAVLHRPGQALLGHYKPSDDHWQDQQGHDPMDRSLSDCVAVMLHLHLHPSVMPT